MQFFLAILLVCIVQIEQLNPVNNINRHNNIPDGYTFGWNNGGSNLHLGGVAG